jgi:anti-sigma factor RsiW
VAMNACPGEETLYEFLDSELSPDRELEMLRHLSSCERCLAEVARMRKEMDAIDVAFRISEFALEEDVADLKPREALVLGQMRWEGVISVQPFELRKVVLREAIGVARATRKVVVKGIAAARPLFTKTSRVARLAVRAGGAAGRTLARGIGAVLRPTLMRLEVGF